MAAREPEDCDRLFGEYVNAGRLDELLDLYEDDAVLVQQDGSAARGREALRAALAPMLAAGARMHMHVVRSVRAGDVALLHNDWTMTATAPDGSAVRAEGRALEVVRRQPDGSWRFVVDDPFSR